MLGQLQGLLEEKNNWQQSLLPKSHPILDGLNLSNQNVDVRALLQRTHLRTKEIIEVEDVQRRYRHRYQQTGLVMILNSIQGWIQQCFFRRVPGESSGEGARPLGGSGAFLRENFEN